MGHPMNGENPVPPMEMILWPEVMERAHEMAAKIAEIKRPEGSPYPLVYGVPRGGCTVATLVGVPVDRPADAQVFVDDIIDSGTTRDAYEQHYPEVPFFALFNKEEERDAGRGWLVFPWEQNSDKVGPRDSVIRLIQFIGEDPRREGLVDTPQRVLRAFKEQTAGYMHSPSQILGMTFTAECDELIVQRRIPFWSLCEHHLMPFHGQATVGYVPSEGRIVGISKLARTVECFARRLQIQERMTQQIAEALMENLEPKGAGCIIRATHLCMAARGIERESETVTSCLLGVMREDAGKEFLGLEKE
jgi:GTP cyclohydrolase I